ncbi:class I adenylate-forming enzyme family protein [Mobiluncus porci]|uniref:Acyl--CoA ligase n=1 Tax=Mobiluncus porci TaxID=2652278 RepID=A0A7K0K2J1_9ACTO|nr:acyl--CoA ligase [Mobiluncus porci]
MPSETIDYSPLKLLHGAALRHPGRKSLIWVREKTSVENLRESETWSVSESFARVVALARAFRDWGVAAGDRVAVIGKNSPWHLVAFAAGSAIPAITVPINWQLPQAELAETLAHCSPKVILVDETNRAKVESALARASAGSTILVTFAELASLTSPEVLARSVSSDPLALAIAASRGLGPIPVCGDSTAGAIIYTSGTAARPKGTLLTYKNLWWGCLNFREAFEYSPDCVEAVAAPLSHIGGFNGTTTDLFTNGGTVVVFEKFEPRLLLAAIEAFGIQMMFGVPTMFRLLADVAEASAFDTSSFTRALVGGAAWDRELARRVVELGWGPINIWGMTEQSASGACLTTDVMAGREVGVGRSFPHIELRVSGLDGEPVPAGAIGQVECRGPSVTREYFRDPELTAAAIDPETGWFQTGDLVLLDEDGFLRLMGRLTDTINSGGEKIFAVKVASVLAAHPQVAEVQVLGIPDPLWGEVVGAVVVPRGFLTLADLQDFGRPTLAPYELPRRLALVDAIPLNANGKPDRESLRALFETHDASREFSD